MFTRSEVINPLEARFLHAPPSLEGI